MGLLSRQLDRRASAGGDPVEEAAPTHAGETDLLGGLGALVSQVHRFQQSPLASADASRMMAEAEDLQGEIREIVARHGFDGAQIAAGPDIGDATEMQREIMAAMSRHGFGPGALPAAAPPPRPPADDGPIRDPLSGG